jgi:hypothetical protein
MIAREGPAEPKPDRSPSSALTGCPSVPLDNQRTRSRFIRQGGRKSRPSSGAAVRVKLGSARRTQDHAAVNSR